MADLMNTVKNVDINGFSQWGEKKILLYGAGNLGRALFDCLRKNNIEVIGLIDEKSHELDFQDGVLYALNDVELKQFTNHAVVILAALFSIEQDCSIRKKLKKLGFREVYGLYEINWHSIDSYKFCKKMFIGDYDVKNILNDREKINNAYDLFSSGEEKQFFLNYIKAYLNFDVTIFPYPIGVQYQYLAHDIEHVIDYSRFIDCGAYTGDTLSNLLKSGKNIKKYIAFEPQESLCNIIKMSVDTIQSIDEYCILPCGVADTFIKLRFSVSDEGKSAGKIDADGSEVIQCVPIDAVAYGFEPTFIKMDIEGMEIEALKGAAKIIKKYKPYLAICIYHDLSHLWEVPLLIKNIYPNYKFYIRNYQFMGLETVVYAFPDE